MTTTTKHTCGGPHFGRRTPGCPRCDELAAGAAPVRWAISQTRRIDEMHRRAVAEHDCGRARCGIVCTFGEW